MKIIIGSAQFGMDYGIANKIGKVNSKQIDSIIKLAKLYDINTFDTASSYGNSESRIGEYIKKNPSSNLKIITKISGEDKPLRVQINNAITKITIKPIAILAHSSALYVSPFFQDELMDIKKEYKIGVSIYNKKELDQVLGSDNIPDIIQIPINILDTRLFRDGSLKRMKKMGVCIHARSVFLQGLFYLSENELNSRFPDVSSTISELKSIANNENISISELSLLWLKNLVEIDKIIIGVDSEEQLKTHINTLRKSIDGKVFDMALKLKYENEKILNPSLWD
jgi:Predicted oxidoreductases (related to aryl-alcohol dehydrogenases)